MIFPNARQFGRIFQVLSYVHINLINEHLQNAGRWALCTLISYFSARTSLWRKLVTEISSLEVTFRLGLASGGNLSLKFRLYKLRSG